MKLTEKHTDALTTTTLALASSGSQPLPIALKPLVDLLGVEDALVTLEAGLASGLLAFTPKGWVRPGENFPLQKRNPIQ